MARKLPIVADSVSVFVVRTRGGRAEVLLLRRAEAGDLQGTWCQVAGKIEKGEAAWQTALREVTEETGLEVERLYSADICEQYYSPGSDRIDLTPVFVAFAGAGQEVVLDGEHSEHRWVSFEEAERMIPFAGQRAALAHVRREFVAREPNELLRIRPGEGA